MVDYKAQKLDTIFHALSDSTRRSMLAMLQGSEKTVSDLAEPFDMSLAAASKHIKKLEAAGLVEREVKGRVHHCRLSPQQLRQASEWLKTYEQYWNARLDRLEDLLKADDANQTTNEGDI